MQKNYYLLLTKIILFYICVSLSVILNAQVGIGTTNPDAELDIVNSSTSGNTLQVNHDSVFNGDAAIFINHQGQGSAIFAQNQNNSIIGTITIGSFNYTGTDVADHVGVSGSSSPADGWGVGVLGIGSFYGVFSNGNLGASGTKTFLIDHPEDPANKMLKHFSVESNEVLNIYRGIEVFDEDGRAFISLPDYYEAINKNPSYQLTPIGAAMPDLYVESEIVNGQFVIAGGAPNKKVSWQITAERNDPYLQQNPEEREVVIDKEVDRKGKYFNPELYNQPEEKGMFYRDTKNQNTSKLVPSPKILQSIKESKENLERSLKEESNND